MFLPAKSNALSQLGPAVEWMMERYQVTRDKDSGIANDPNDRCREHDQPRYIIDLIGRVVRVSIETMKIVNGLPALRERTANDRTLDNRATDTVQ